MPVFDLRVKASADKKRAKTAAAVFILIYLFNNLQNDLA
jgi:hypothetical protein